MRYQPIPLVGDSYADETRPWSMQDTVNWLPASAEVEGTRSDAILKTPPGLKPFLEIPATGEDAIPSPPVRRTHNAEGKLFTVIGTMLYRISNAGIAIPVGQVPGIGRVVMAHNQISLGNEILAVNGQAGYVYNTVTEVFERITDDGYPGSATAVFIDGYLVQIEPQGRYAFNSEVASATQYNTLDRFTSEVSPDRLVGLAAFNNKLLLLSKTTSEFFENRGDSQQPFRSTRITMDKGCAGPYAVAHADTTVFFLGSDGMFYRVDGYRPVRISKRPLEQAIRGLNWTQAFAEVWEDAGFTVIYWTFPDGRTWGYNTADGRWHRRESYGLNRWRVNTLTRWNERWIAGDFQTGRLWEMDWDYILEGDQEFIGERTLAVIHDNQHLVVIPRVEVVMDTGQPETVPIPFPDQPEGPTITGDAPDGIVGVTYAEYPYTITGGTPPYVVTQRPTSTIADTGLEMNTAGVIQEASPTTVGDFLSVPRVTDANGLWDEIEDDIHIGAAWWAVSKSSFEATRVWISGNPILFSGPGYPRGGSTINPDFYGIKCVGPNTMMFFGTAASAERTVDGDPADGITSTTVSMLASVRCVRVIDGIVFAMDGTNNYRTSEDDGATWTNRATAGRNMLDVARLESGRWISYQFDGSDQRFVYSDQEVPTTWIDATIPPHFAYTNSGFIACNGDAACMVSAGGYVQRTTDGVIWDEITPVPLLSVLEIVDAIAVGDVFMFATGNNDGSLIRSDDAGLTWGETPTLVTDMARIEYGEGTYFLTGFDLGTGSGLYAVSTDDGLTWAPCTMPDIEQWTAAMRVTA